MPFTTGRRDDPMPTLDEPAGLTVNVESSDDPALNGLSLLTRRQIMKNTTPMLRILLSVAVLNAPRAFAQKADLPKDTARWTTGATQLRAGSMQLGLDQLNASLVESHRPTFANTVPTLGISTYARRGRLLGGASIDGSLPHRGTDATWTTKLTVSTATLDGGYVLIDGSRLMISTNVSVGVRSTWLHFERRGDFSYDDGLADPARGVDLMSRTGVAQLGLSVERRFELGRVGMFSLVGQGGTMRPFGGPATFAGENRVRGTPEQDAGGYARIAISKPIARGARALDMVSGALLSMIFR